MESIKRSEIETACLKTIALEMNLNPDDLSLDMELRDDLDIVSLDAMNIIMALEDQFKVEADIESVLEMQIVQDIVDHLETRLNNKSSNS